MDKKIIISTNLVYIGDPCYELEDDLYDGVWGKKNYKDGIIREDIGIVHGTYYGDGCYEGDEGYYAVDSGTLSILDGNMCKKDESGIFGNFIDLKEGSHELRLKYERGKFTFFIDGKVVEEVKTKVA